MRIHHFTLGIALFVLTSGVGTANAKTQNITCNFAASFADGVETNIDTNSDGRSATLAQSINNCSFGRFFIQVETELVAVTSNTTCKPGLLEEHLVQNHSVWTEEKSSDQLFWSTTSLTFCVDLSSPDLPFTYTGQATVTGGTGKFAGAAGTLNFQGAGKYLVFGFKGGPSGPFGGFGQFTETESGTLSLPHPGNGKDD
jgi:hypothetical protein